jgi:ankyrin repeat protein
MNEQEELNGRLIQAARSCDVAALEKALADGADARARARGSNALEWAAALGHLGCVRVLIGASDPKADDSGALSAAAGRGATECVKFLIGVSEPKAQDSYALRVAADNGHVECVRLLIPVSDPLARDSVALRWAAVMGHADCVALLLPASDPLAVGDYGLDAAALARSRGHVEVAGMIDAFIEAGELSKAAQHAKVSPRVKSTL